MRVVWCEERVVVQLEMQRGKEKLESPPEFAISPAVYLTGEQHTKTG